MIASVGHQRVFIRALIYKPPPAFQPIDQLLQVLKTFFSLCPLQKLLKKHAFKNMLILWTLYLETNQMKSMSFKLYSDLSVLLDPHLC